MKLGTVFRIFIFSFLLSFVARFSSLEFQSWQQNRYTDSLCSLAGNYLEIGSLREAFEAMQAGLLRSGQRDACVSLIDNGRSYAPNCIQQEQKYHTTLCKAESNSGVRAEIHYPVGTLFDFNFLYLFALFFISLIALMFGLQTAVTFLAQRIVFETQGRLLGYANINEPTSALGHTLHWLFDKTGVLQTVAAQTQNFESQLRESQKQIREETLLRARKEAEAEKSKEYVEKVRQIRHDIRSPLTSLLSIKDALEGDEQVHQALSSAIRRVHLMIDDLEQVDQQAAAPRLAIVEVLAEEVVATLRSKFFSSKQVRIDLKYDSNRLSPVMAVPDDFKRILDNLLENAFDAISVEGHIQISISSDASRCQISVEDNGCGIAPENLPRLFSKGATFGKIDGVGLGLYHSKKSIESWRGTIVCEPLSLGTRFTVKLPLVQTGITHIGLASDLRNIVVIDDDITTAAVLKRAGYLVCQTANSFFEGRELLSRLGSDRGFVLVDEHLGDGLLGTDLIAEQRDHRGLVLCTNDFDNPDVIRRAKRIGVRVLPKPLCFYAEPRVDRLEPMVATP